MLYKCEPCKFKTVSKTDFTRHCETQKHNEKCTKTIEIPNTVFFGIEKYCDNNVNNSKNNESLIINNREVTFSDTKDKQNICEYCNKIFVQRYSLYRHIRICKEKIRKDEIEKITLEHKLELYKQRVEMLEKNSEKYEQNEEFHKKVIVSSNNNVGKSIESGMRVH